MYLNFEKINTSYKIPCRFYVVPRCLVIGNYWPFAQSDEIKSVYTGSVNINLDLDNRRLIIIYLNPVENNIFLNNLATKL